MAVERPTVTVTTDSSGDATVFLGSELSDGTMGAITGIILGVIYTKTDFDDGVDFTITTEKTLQNVWVESDVNASKQVNPSLATHDTVGVAASSRDYIMAVKERIKVVVANGGSVKTALFTLLYEKA